jgi:acyl-homoserine-lactone acylase
MKKYFSYSIVKNLVLRYCVLSISAQLPIHLFSQETFSRIDPQKITIARDSFGIPHIYAETDAEVAYGLAWANDEDAFSEAQNLVYIGHGYMARKDGIEGAKTDFFVHAIGARKLVEEHYDKDLSPDFKKYLDGFVQGLNAYAAAHPDEVKVKAAFPATAKDILTAYVVTMSALSHAPDYIGDAITGKYDNSSAGLQVKQPPVGSNAFALNSSKTTDGKTYLCINPHMGMDGPLSFYEAQLHSNEGLNIEGAMFEGTSSLAMGVNEDLGWGMTWNFFDRLDAYKLSMDPKRKLYYQFDGEYYKLEKRPVWLKVGLGKHHKIVIPVKKMTYWSKYGCTIKSDKSNNFYSIRFPGNESIMAGEQLYRMNKAHNYNEFWDALRIHAIVLFNVIYADKDNNIFYLENGTLPERDTTYDWEKLLPGNTSKTLWTRLVPIDSMPHTINPACGYVYNCNNTPFHSTGTECNEAGCIFPRRIIDERPGDNNRSIRFKEMMDARNKVSFEDLQKMKFDVTLSQHGKYAESLNNLFTLDEYKYPDIKDAIHILKTWNRVFEIHEYAPTILFLVLRDAFLKRGCDDNCFVTGINVSDDEWVSDIRAACDTLKARFGTIKVEWGTVHRNIRGNVNFPLRGFADMLSPSYPNIKSDKFPLTPEYGDSYIMFASFGKEGLEKLLALEPIGNSLNPQSPHNNDQIALFSRQQLRTLSLKKEDVMKSAEKKYHPM